MKIALGNDHAGTTMRPVVIEELKKAGHDILDFGTDGVESVDYPDYARKVAEAVACGQADRGVLVCGTGIGMAIAANKVPGIRAAVCTDAYGARMARQHNDANVLATRAREIDPDRVREVVRVFMSESFEGGRHQRRIDKITRLESDPTTPSTPC